MTSEYQCGFCENYFKTQSSLNKHKKTANFCVLIQKEKITTENKNLYAQLDIKDQEIKRLEKNIQELQTMLKDLASEAINKPSSVTNNSVNNSRIIQYLAPMTLTEEKIEKILKEKFDSNYFWEAQRGLARFCVDHILKTEDGKMLLVCTDPVRNRFKYVDINNNLLEDIEGRRFIEKIAKPVRTITKEKYLEMIDQINKELNDMEEGVIPSNSERAEVLIFKRDNSIDKLSDIHSFSDPSSNHTFLKEMTILTRM